MADVRSFTADDDKAKVADAAIESPKVLAEVVSALGCDDRRLRQFSSAVVNAIASSRPELLKPFGEELADALHRPEPQTRWEVLDTFEKLVAVDARLVDKALAGTETALHDEESGVVRLAAFRVLTSYGATTERRSERIWPLVAEAVRCYHGDPEFTAMLSGVYRLVTGSASDEVKIAAADLMRFDAENAKGPLKKKASRIVEAAPKTRGKKK
jgi:hypothetical protein